MVAPAVLQIIRSRAEQSLFLLRKALPLTQPVAAYSGWTPQERETLGHLLTACARSSESTLLLVAFGQFWDAEIVARSIAEGTLKLCYLLQQQETFQARHEEYANDLFQVGLLKDHAKASDLLANVLDPDSTAWRPIRERLLGAEEIEAIRTRYPSPARRELEAKWGFARLMGALSQPGGNQLRAVHGVAHGYALASHVHHADCIGIALPFEHDLRSEDRRDAVHEAHSLRLTFDPLSFLLLRLMVAYRFVGENLAPVLELEREIADLRKSTGDVFDSWIRVEYPEPKS